MGSPPPPGCPPPPPPPATPALISSPAGALAGSLYVEGSGLRYVSSAGAAVYGGTGVSVDTPAGAVKGSINVSGTGNFLYIDSSGIRRSLDRTSLGAQPGGAIAGSIAVDSPQAVAKQFTWVDGTTKYQWWNGF